MAAQIKDRIPRAVLSEPPPKREKRVWPLPQKMQFFQQRVVPGHVGAPVVDDRLDVNPRIPRCQRMDPGGVQQGISQPRRGKDEHPAFRPQPDWPAAWRPHHGQHPKDRLIRQQIDR